MFFFFFFFLLQNTFLSFPEHLSGGYWRIFRKASKQNAINMKLETIWTKCFNNGRLQVRSNLSPSIFCLLMLTHLDKIQFMIKPTGRMLGLCELKQTFCWWFNHTSCTQKHKLLSYKHSVFPSDDTHNILYYILEFQVIHNQINTQNNSVKAVALTFYKWESQRGKGTFNVLDITWCWQMGNTK